MAPTLEEFERNLGQTLKEHNPLVKLSEDVTPKKITLALGINIKYVIANLDTKGIFKGFIRKFCEVQAIGLEKTEKWKAFSSVLALMIYGIVLFPNVDNYVDNLDIEVYLLGNPVPFLLDDIYYSFHTRHEKKGGTFLCCAPLLHTLFMSHMPKEGSFVYKDVK